MKIFKSRWVQTVGLACGVTLLFGGISYSVLAQAFPKNAEQEARIKQFQSTWNKRAQYYAKLRSNDR
ncbi:hypothetical protein ABEW33_23340 [Priestia megaterium]|uniref:hypothetical protein n=1 Tax=Priestia megaterium TaxID=1404 RepID=UPI0030C8F7C8